MIGLLAVENPDTFSQGGWLVFFKALAIFVYLVVTTLLVIWAERRVVARMQSRPGPNRTGPFGLLQSLADGVKLAFKEDIVPTAADKVVFVLAPIISCTTAFLAFAVIPFGPTARIPFTDITTPLQLTDMPVAVLFVLAVASVGVYGLVLSGWSSGSTYPLLGGLRSSAQVISYEIAMGLSLVAVFLYAGSMSTSQIVKAQAGVAAQTFFGHTIQMPSWYAIMLPVSFIIYCVSMVGETNRAPFDLPEAEGELVGGFHTEYSSLKFALFFLAEYVNMVTVSAIATTLFLGGWRAPFPISLWDSANQGWWPVLWFTLKVWGFLFVFIWLRGTLPRLRYDQFMKLGWKVLIPTALGWIVVVSLIRWSQTTGDVTRAQRLLLVGVVFAVLVVGYLVITGVEGKRQKARQARSAPPPAEVDPFAGGFPVPPLPGQRLVRTSGRVRALSGAGTTIAGERADLDLDLDLDLDDDGGDGDGGSDDDSGPRGSWEVKRG